MHRKTLSKLALTTLVLLLIVFPASIAYAAYEGTSDGTATVGNATPTVTTSNIYDSAESASVNNTNLDVNTEYHVNCTVTDNNQLYDLENVTFTIWENTYGSEGGADSKVNHYTFKYDNATDAWDEIGPDGPGDSHLVSGSCSDPTDHTATSGEFKLAFKFHKTANYTSTKTWTVKIIAYDTEASGNQQDIWVGVSFYREITVNDGTHNWGTLTAGTDDNVLSGDGDIDVTVTANAKFDLQAKGDGNLDGPGANEIGLGNITIHATTLGSSVALTTTYADIGGLTAQDSGEDQAKAFKLWINIPSGTPDGDYIYQLSVQVVQA